MANNEAMKGIFEMRPADRNLPLGFTARAALALLLSVSLLSAAETGPAAPATENSTATALPVLVRMAKDGDPAIRRMAVESLGETGRSEYLDVILAALDDPYPEVREAAARSLTSFDGKGLSERVLGLLCAAWPGSAEKLGGVLPFLKERIEEPMLAILESADEAPLRRSAAAYSLGVMRSAKATSALAASAWADDATLAMTSVQALAAVNAPEAALPLARLLQHPLAAARDLALQGLAALGTPQTVYVLGAVAADSTEATRPLQLRAVDLLAESASEAAVPALIEAMRRNLFVRTRAAAALRRRTGAELGDIPSGWAEWYEASRRPAEEPPPLLPHEEEPPIMAGTPGDYAPQNPPPSTIPQLPDAWPPPWMDPRYDPQPEQQERR